MKKYFKIVVLVFCILWISKEILFPIGTAALYSTSYMTYVVKCDSAMSSSWYINQTNNEQLMQSEKIQMLDCHEYDKVRKIMLISGLPENYLSYLGLRALEINQRPIEEFVEQHRFIER